MTDLARPDGTAYPTTVQHFAEQWAPDEGGAHNAQRRELVDALEHRPAELDQEHQNRLVNIYAAGMGSGGATALIQLQVHPERAQQMGLIIAGRMLEDPATRLMLEQMTTRMWTGAYDEPIQWQSFTAYPSPRNHRDD